MANVDRPNGFTVSQAYGSGDGSRVRPYQVDAANATAIFRGDPVTLEADGKITPAAAGGRVLGVVVGIKYEQGSIAETEHPGYLPASTAGEVMVSIDRDAVYECQEDAGSLTVADIGMNIDTLAGAGSTTTGRSGHELDSSSVLAANGQFRIIGLANRADNAVGTNARWLVVVNEGHMTSEVGI